ncbi:MAG: hypothetical protein HQL69_21720 [Magnetococcales bacterium]|nr:hypothetical protein [Magnetococcales bacterium]
MDNGKLPEVVKQPSTKDNTETTPHDVALTSNAQGDLIGNSVNKIGALVVRNQKTLAMSAKVGSLSSKPEEVYAPKSKAQARQEAPGTQLTPPRRAASQPPNHYPWQVTPFELEDRYVFTFDAISEDPSALLPEKLPTKLHHAISSNIICHQGDKAGSQSTSDTGMQNMTQHDIAQNHLHLPMIGSGSYGLVFQGIDKHNGRSIAIKMIDSDNRKTPYDVYSQETHFKVELNKLRKLVNVPCVLQLEREIEFGVEPEKIHILKKNQDLNHQPQTGDGRQFFFYQYLTVSPEELDGSTNDFKQLVKIIAGNSQDDDVAFLNEKLKTHNINTEITQDKKDRARIVLRAMIEQKIGSHILLNGALLLITAFYTQQLKQYVDSLTFATNARSAEKYREVRPKLRECFKILRDVAKGLKYLHYNKYIHYDICPYNIMHNVQHQTLEADQLQVCINPEIRSISDVQACIIDIGTVEGLTEKEVDGSMTFLFSDSAKRQYRNRKGYTLPEYQKRETDIPEDFVVDVTWKANSEPGSTGKDLMIRIIQKTDLSTSNYVSSYIMEQMEGVRFDEEADTTCDINDNQEFTHYKEHDVIICENEFHFRLASEQDTDGWHKVKDVFQILPQLGTFISTDVKDRIWNDDGYVKTSSAWSNIDSDIWRCNQKLTSQRFIGMAADLYSFGKLMIYLLFNVGEKRLVKMVPDQYAGLNSKFKDHFHFESIVTRAKRYNLERFLEIALKCLFIVPDGTGSDPSISQTYIKDVRQVCVTPTLCMVHDLEQAYEEYIALERNNTIREDFRNTNEKLIELERELKQLKSEGIINVNEKIVLASQQQKEALKDAQSKLRTNATTIQELNNELAKTQQQADEAEEKYVRLYKASQKERDQLIGVTSKLQEIDIAISKLPDPTVWSENSIQRINQVIDEITMFREWLHQWKDLGNTSMAPGKPVEAIKKLLKNTQDDHNTLKRISDKLSITGREDPEVVISNLKENYDRIIVGWNKVLDQINNTNKSPGTLQAKRALSNLMTNLEKIRDEDILSHKTNV